MLDDLKLSILSFIAQNEPVRLGLVIKWLRRVFGVSVSCDSLHAFARQQLPSVSHWSTDTSTQNIVYQRNKTLLSVADAPEAVPAADPAAESVFSLF